ncbi:toprim domain-containing protein, partial [Bacteroides fragilis]
SFKQYAKEHPEMPALGKLDLCVLNSTSIVERSKDFLSRYEKVHAFLDNDAPGREALRKMRHFLPKDTVLVNEAERLYPSCNDFNEFLQKIKCPASGREM